MSNLYAYYSQVAFLTLIVVNHAWEFYLSQRQLEAYQKNFGALPKEFQGFLSLEDHQKAIRYGTSKLRLGQVRLVFDALLMLYWFPMRGAEKLYLSLPDIGIHREVLFLLAFSFFQVLIHLPFSIFSTFSLEQRYGFNRSTPKLFIQDRIKGLALGLLLGGPIIYLLLYLFEALGDWWWLASFFALTAFQFILIWLYPNYIAPLFNKFSPLSKEDLKQGIEGLVHRAGFEAKEVYVMDASKRSAHGNAYFTGFGKNKRVVFFDTLLEQLQNSEILAILSHELGHLKLKHIPKSLAASIVLSFFGFWFMGKCAQSVWFYQGNFVRVLAPSMLFLIFTQAIPVYTFWLSPVGTWISRRREFEADAYAAKETNAKDLISGLLKLYQHNASPTVTDSVYSGFYHSHPPALQRIKRLESLER